MIRIQNYLIALIFIAIGLTGCSGVEKIEQPLQNREFSLNDEVTIGQTFVSRFNGLSGITIYIKPEEIGEGDLIIHIRENTQANNDIQLTTKPLSEIKSSGSYKFKFPPINTSSNKYYYMFLELTQPTRLNLAGADGNTYINGALYKNHIPQEAQLSFGLIYDTKVVISGLIRDAFIWLKWSLLACFLFIFPGWGLLGIIWRGWNSYDWMEKLGLSIGVSLSIYPLIILWTNQIGFHLGRLYAWIPPLIGIGLILVRLRVPLVPNKDFLKNKKLFNELPNILLVIIVFSIIVSRFWAIRNLDAPMWGDSYQHTMIAQLFLDNGGLFTSWRPYAPYDSFSVHYGFSLASALYSWISHDNVTHATLVIGQVINCFAIFTLYLLAMLISNRNRWAGIGTLVVAGLLSPMPAFYVNWGRFAQLSGQVILPVSLWIFWCYVGGLNYPSMNSKNAASSSISRYSIFIDPILVGVVIAGMSLYYYRMPIFFSAFVIAWLLTWGLYKWRFNLHSWLRIFLRMCIVGFLGGLLILPRLFQSTTGNLNEIVETGLKANIPLTNVINEYRSWISLPIYWSKILIILTFFALFWGIFRKNIPIITIFLWFIFLSFFIAGKLINLPGAILMDNFTILIAVYIPASLISGWLLGEFSNNTIDRLRIPGILLITSGFLCLTLFGAVRTRSVAQPASFSLVNRPDSNAMQWIQNNVIKDALFLVEGFRTHNGRFAVGSDSGWWIPLLTNRNNTMPPQYALTAEMPNPPDYTRNIVNIVATLETIGLDTPEGVDLLCKNKITHVFIGQSQGSTASYPTQLYSPDELLSSPKYDLVYHQDRVYIFALNSNACLGVTAQKN